MYLCECVSEEGGDVDGAGSEVSSLLLYTLRYVSVELDTLYQFGWRVQMYLCVHVREEGEDGEGTDSEVPSLMS